MGYEELFQAGIGFVIPFVTEQAKKFALINNPAMKVITVLLLAGIGNVILLWAMTGTVVPIDAFRGGILSAIIAMVSKAGHKTVANGGKK